jgi:hypothetical protein
VNVDFSPAKLSPCGINEYQKTVGFKISLPSGAEVWDNSNDFSYNGTQSTDWQGVITKKIPVYENGVRAYGEEPEGGAASPTPTSKKPTTPPLPTPTTPSETKYKVSGIVKPGFSFSSSRSLRKPDSQTQTTRTETLHSQTILPANLYLHTHRRHTQRHTHTTHTQKTDILAHTTTTTKQL